MRSSPDDDEHQGANVEAVAADHCRRAAACPIGRSTLGNHGHSRIAPCSRWPADGQADPQRKPTF